MNPLLFPGGSALSPNAGENAGAQVVYLSLVVPETDRFGALAQRVSGKTGATTRPKVELITPANDVYQATSAVINPT
jgi:hypothetical protein